MNTEYKILLVDDEQDILESGIDIIAKPLNQYLVVQEYFKTFAAGFW